MKTAFDAADRSGKLVYSDEHHCIAVAGRCIVTYSTQPPSEQYFSAWYTAVEQILAQDRGQLTVVTIIDGQAQIPDEPTRALIRAAMHRFGPSVERLVYVVEGRGFVAAAMRSVLSLINLAARNPYPQKVFANVGEAGVWLTRTPTRSGAGMDARALGSLVHSMRDAVTGLVRAG